MILVSPQYLEQLRGVHASQTWGASGYSHAETVWQWAKETGCNTILDFGCGRGTFKPELLKLHPTINHDDIREYDPAIPGKDGTPEQADMLVATDVLEHIEPDRVKPTLKWMRGLCRVAAFFTIALTPSKVSLPDGRNAHILLMSEHQWLAHLVGAGFHVSKATKIKGLWVWCET